MKHAMTSRSPRACARTHGRPERVEGFTRAGRPPSPRRARIVSAFDPRWEAMKATRRAVSHHAAVQESAAITRTQWKLMGKTMSAEIPPAHSTIPDT